MSERKVLSKYYPPDFDPATLAARRRGPKPTGPKVQTVRIAAPFTMRCTRCGEFIYRGRKFNARKEVDAEERYLGVQIVRIHMRCTRCSSEITYRTDPKNNEYMMVGGAIRNSEPWRDRNAEGETDEQRLDRLEREEAELEGEEERDAMADLEAKNTDARREMAAADALDAIRQRNARIQMAEKEGVDVAASALWAEDEERARKTEEEEAAAVRIAYEEAKERVRLEMEALEEREDEERRREEERRLAEAASPKRKRPESTKKIIPGLKVKRVKVQDKTVEKPVEKPKARPSLLVSYSSDDDDGSDDDS